MKEILVVGSGGREHTIARELVAPDRKLYVAPGNAGTALIAENVDIPSDKIPQLVDFAAKRMISFTVVGPEQPLVDGIVDEFKTPIFGPSADAARIEGSKAWAARYQERFNIPSPKAWVFSDYREARQFIECHPMPMVVKPDGLTAGKGVQVCKVVEDGTNKQALIAVQRMLVDQEFGSAGKTIIIQEFLEGEETTVMAFSDGKYVIPMIGAQDYKELNGRMTGGMGSRAPVGTPEILDEVYQRVLLPTINGMREIGSPYKGVLYAGLMLTREGPKVLEFNCRFGDPEAQVVLPLLQSDLLMVLEACVGGKLNTVSIEWQDKACVCVVLASAGYPDNPVINKRIYGAEEFNRQNYSDVWLIHAGTRKQDDCLVTSGGRVLAICASGKTMSDAAQKAYSFIPNRIHFEGMQYKDNIR